MIHVLFGNVEHLSIAPGLDILSLDQHSDIQEVQGNSNSFPHLKKFPGSY